MLLAAAVPVMAKSPAAEKGWQAIAPADWEVASAPAVMDVVAPAYRGFPETAEGNPSLSVELARSPKGEGFTATVTKQGLADDAVGAEQIRLRIDYRNGNWHLRDAARRWQCRRGIMAGSWTVSRCP